jgi:hypothetical protein
MLLKLYVADAALRAALERLNVHDVRVTEVQKDARAQLRRDL